MRIQTYVDNGRWRPGSTLEKYDVVLKEDAHIQGLLHLSTHLIILDSNRRILSRKRADTELRYTGMWTTTIGTHVELDNDYLGSLEDLLPQEMKLTWVGEFRVHDMFENEVNGLHVCILDEDDTLPEEFMSDRSFLPLIELRDEIRAKNATPHLVEAFLLMSEAGFVA